MVRIPPSPPILLSKLLSLRGLRPRKYNRLLLRAAADDKSDISAELLREIHYDQQAVGRIIRLVDSVELSMRPFSPRRPG